MTEKTPGQPEPTHYNSTLLHLNEQEMHDLYNDLLKQLKYVQARCNDADLIDVKDEDIGGEDRSSLTRPDSFIESGPGNEHAQFCTWALYQISVLEKRQVPSLSDLVSALIELDARIKELREKLPKDPQADDYSEASA